MKLRTFFTGLSLLAITTLPAQEAERELAINNYKKYYNEAKEYHDIPKREAIGRLRIYFKSHPHRQKAETKLQEVNDYLNQLTEKGSFADLDAQEDFFLRNDIFNKGYANTSEDQGGIFLHSAYERIYHIANAYQHGLINEDEALSDKVLKSILHYGNIETGRRNDRPRFHASCFAIPTAATNIYFALLDEMNEAERGEAGKLMTSACEMLKTVGLQAWTQPLRNDDTDRNVVSIERFRNHVWWVGGNALAYRSLLQVAAMYSSIPMIDLLAEVCQRGISMTSQTTYNDAFWTEGFTADGAGWGHGKQCLVWGYPIDGTSSAIAMLNMLKGSPWAQQLTKENTDALMNFFRGSNWYYYKGYKLPGLERKSYEYREHAEKIPYKKMLDNVIKNWLSSFTPEEQQELKQLQQEVKSDRIDMKGYLPGEYSGVRWFFNNDDLMKKTEKYHINVNMASYRCDGLESAAFADNYNFYPTDGATLFQRTGNEYYTIMGGWDVTAMPGVTAREGMDKLTAVTNWRGYCSKYNFAAGATDSENNAVAGFIFEKMNGSDKKGVNDKGNRNTKNEILYGFKAYKGYFIAGDYFVALGAGITNMRPEMEGHIRTTIDQTALTGKVKILKGRKVTSPDNGITTLNVTGNKATWICQEGKFSYSLLPEYSVQAHIALETCPTNWVKMNPTNKKKNGLPQKVNILRLWVDHGQHPIDDKYGYVVYTGDGQPQSRLPFEVLQNDTLVQAIQTKDKTLLQAVFYPGGKELVHKNLNIEVSDPCALMIQEKGGKRSISISDATMNPELKVITVIINGKKIDVPLPQGQYCGSCVTVDLD